MQLRLRLLMASTALLYIGPLLAGLGGFGWGLVPAFIVLFMLWLFILRPQQWPRSFAEWNRPEAWTTLATNGVVQVFLVSMLFGIGRGIGGVLGSVPEFPAEVPLAISFLSIPLSRLIWDPWKGAQFDEFLDEAIHSINHMSAAAAADDGDLVQARRMLKPIAELPDSVDEAEVARHLRALSKHAMPLAIRTALMERERTGQSGRAETLALILHTTDVNLLQALGGDSPTLTLALIDSDPAKIAVFARRLIKALTQEPLIWGQCPTVDRLEELVARYDNTDAEAPLRDLIEATDAAAPEDGLA